MSTSATLENVSLIPFSDPQNSSDRGAAKGKSQRLEAKGNTKHVLVIDDEIGIAKSLGESLAGHRYEARAVYSGVDLINYCEL